MPGGFWDSNPGLYCRKASLLLLCHTACALNSSCKRVHLGPAPREAIKHSNEDGPDPGSTSLWASLLPRQRSRARTGDQKCFSWVLQEKMSWWDRTHSPVLPEGPEFALWVRCRESQTCARRDATARGSGKVAVGCFCKWGPQVRGYCAASVLGASYS